MNILTPKGTTSDLSDECASERQTSALLRKRRQGRRTSRVKRARYGVAAVEFAIVGPVFLLMVFGIIELGRALMVQQLITNASRAGARSAAMMSSTNSDVTNDITEYMTQLRVSNVSISVAPDAAVAEAGDEITVAVSLNFADVSWLPTAWFLDGTTLSASSVMRKEGFQ